MAISRTENYFRVAGEFNYHERKELIAQMSMEEVFHEKLGPAEGKREDRPVATPPQDAAGSKVRRKKEGNCLLRVSLPPGSPQGLR